MSDDVPVKRKRGRPKFADADLKRPRPGKMAREIAEASARNAAEVEAIRTAKAAQILPPDPRPSPNHALIGTPAYVVSATKVSEGTKQFMAGMNSRALRRRAAVMLREMTPDAVTQFKKLVADGGGDSRVQMVAIKELFDRNLGQAGSLPLGAEENDGSGVDLDAIVGVLTGPEQEELLAATETVKRLTALAQERMAND